jgi:hypothetical protein
MKLELKGAAVAETVKALRKLNIYFIIDSKKGNAFSGDDVGRYMP